MLLRISIVSGPETLNILQTNSCNVSGLTNGHYYCLYVTGNGVAGAQSQYAVAEPVGLKLP